MSIKAYSPRLQTYYSYDLDRILLELADGKEVYTHHFEYLNPRIWEFVNDRSHLRKCLWSLAEDGLIENINLGSNIYKWKITEKGKNELGKRRK